jgi:hypothetical protein
MVITDLMNILDLTSIQLNRAVAIKEQIEKLTKELASLMGASTNPTSLEKPTMSAAVKKKIAAAQRARWANLRRTESAARSAQPAQKAKKKAMGPAARAKLSAKLKAYWASKRVGKR